MRAIKIIWRREFGAYLRSPFSWVIAALFLLIAGLLFQAFALGSSGGPTLSAFVLERYFFFAGGVAIGAGLLLSFRLISEERQTHSMVLLNTSPIRDSEIVAGKFLASLTFLALLLGLSLYIPLMLKIGNKITFAQIFVGYLGLLLLGSASLAIGLFASALTKHQLVAGVIGLVIVILMCVLFMFAKTLEGAPREVIADLDMWWVRHTQGFVRGVLNLKDVVYYIAVTYFFLLLSVKTLEAKRWQ
jgi:ABC-2 type transport system permease protein